MKKAKYYLMTAAGILLLALGFYLLKIFTDPQWIMRTFPYLCIGIGCGIFGHGLGEILKQKAVKKNPELARQMAIEKEDERNVMHANASKASGFDMMTYVFGALLLVYVFMNVSLEILLPFVGAYLFVQFFALYRRLKIDKEQ